MLGVSGLLAEGTLFVESEEAQEVALILAKAGSQLKIDEKEELSKSSLLIQLAFVAGFKLENTEVDSRGHTHYTFHLIDKWEHRAEVFMRDLASLGMGVKSGFSDKYQNFFWFLRSEYGSHIATSDSYEM